MQLLSQMRKNLNGASVEGFWTDLSSMQNLVSDWQLSDIHELQVRFLLMIARDCRHAIKFRIFYFDLISLNKESNGFATKSGMAVDAKYPN